MNFGSILGSGSSALGGMKGGLGGILGLLGGGLSGLGPAGLIGGGGPLGGMSPSGMIGGAAMGGGSGLDFIKALLGQLGQGGEEEEEEGGALASKLGLQGPGSDTGMARPVKSASTPPDTLPYGRYDTGPYTNYLTRFGGGYGYR